jgi:hypothetical protein
MGKKQISFALLRRRRLARKLACTCPGNVPQFCFPPLAKGGRGDSLLPSRHSLTYPPIRAENPAIKLSVSASSREITFVFSVAFVVNLLSFHARKNIFK